MWIRSLDRHSVRWLLLILLVAAPSCTRSSEEERRSSSAGEAREPGIEGGGRQQDPGLSPSYRIIKQSRFEVQTGKAGILAGAAHNHRVRARSFSGGIRYDAKHPEDSSVNVTVQVDGLEVLTEAKPSDMRKIREAMLTKVLDAEHHPEIRFVSRKVEPIRGGVRIQGDLTLVGKTRPVTVEVALEDLPDRLIVRGTFSILQTDFGIKPYHAALGTIKVADRVTFDFEAIGMR